ncbi:MAG: nucleotidyltransferase family protein [Breznakia sp.]
MKKKRIVGIVCEYNPFHNGHIYHIQKVKELLQPDVLVCVMSGNFVQRGEASICDKWERANIAVLHGVDLVVELPFIYATQSATYFAKAAMEILQLARVQDFVFGSETNDIHSLQQLAKRSFTPSDKTISNAKAYANTHKHLQSNDILAINYLQYKGCMQAHTILRTNAYHGMDIQHDIASASAIREALHQKKDIQHTTPMKNLQTSSMEVYFPYLKTFLLMTPSSTLSSFFMVDEGIEHHFKKQIIHVNSYHDFVKRCTSKKYTSSKIRRTILHLLMQTKKSEVDNTKPINYLRILAFNDIGKHHLALLKNDITIASKFAQIPAYDRKLALKSAQLYALYSDNSIIKRERCAPIYIKNKKDM